MYIFIHFGLEQMWFAHFEGPLLIFMFLFLSGRFVL